MSLYENLLAEVPENRTRVALHVSSAGGRRRYLWLDLRDVQDRNGTPSGPIHCLLFKTEIATVWPDRIVLNSGGFRTPTTRDAFEWIAHKGSRLFVYSDQKVWYVMPNGWTNAPEGRVKFEDGMSFDLTDQ